MITGRNIVILSSLEWDQLWQGPHEIATRHAAQGNRVLFVENTGIRQPSLADTSRVLRRIRRWIKTSRTGGITPVAENIWLASPLVLPPFGNPLKRFVNQRFLVPMIARAAKKNGFVDPLVWAFLPTNTVNSMIRALSGPTSKVAYYCVADFSELTSDARSLESAEERLLKTALVTYAQNWALADRCKKWAENVYVIPYGVNIEAIRSAPPPNLKQSGRPTIGYVGGLHRHVDIDLLIRACKESPGWDWVFVGPVQQPAPSLAKLPNVKLVGAEEHKKLGTWIKSFDVCIVPYMHNRYTATVLPTKINEYLALGKPVVATDIPGVLDFDKRHHVLKVTPCDPPRFLEAIQGELGTSSGAVVEKRQQVAQTSDWTTRFHELETILEAAITEQRIKPHFDT